MGRMNALEFKQWSGGRALADMILRQYRTAHSAPLLISREMIAKAMEVEQAARLDDERETRKRGSK